jgi:hypothetical protein
MDIICKCGHDESEHKGPFGCQVQAGEFGAFCECRKSRTDVLLIHATEQQARIDALIAERDALKAQKLELIKALEAFLDCKFDCDKTARDVLGKVCDD